MAIREISLLLILFTRPKYNKKESHSFGKELLPQQVNPKGKVGMGEWSSGKDVI